jgi:hypothetical protein
MVDLARGVVGIAALRHAFFQQWITEFGPGERRARVGDRSAFDQNVSGTTEGLDSRWQRRGTSSAHGIAIRHQCTRLRACLKKAPASYAEVGLRATVVQHQRRNEPSQPTRPTRARPQSTESWSNQLSQRRAENVDTVGVTGSIPVSPTTKAP